MKGKGGGFAPYGAGMAIFVILFIIFFLLFGKYLVGVGTGS